MVEGALLAMIADRELGKTEDAGLQRNIVGAWVASLQHSGDGKTQQTAISVVNEAEEYLYINLVYGVGLPQMQSLVQANGHSFDKLHIKDEKGVEQDVWFNVDTSLNAMRDAIQRGK